MCHSTVATIAILLIETVLGRRSKDGKAPYGSIVGATTYYLILPALAFVLGLLFFRKPKEGKTNDSQNSSTAQRP